MSERGDSLRAKAAHLRALAETAPTADIYRDLMMLSEKFERLGHHADRWPAYLQAEPAPHWILLS